MTEEQIQKVCELRDAIIAAENMARDLSKELPCIWKAYCEISSAHSTLLFQTRLAGLQWQFVLPEKPS